MRSKWKNNHNRDQAYDQLQNIIVQMATRPVTPGRRDRSDDFKRLVEQALIAYRNYMQAAAG